MEEEEEEELNEVMDELSEVALENHLSINTPENNKVVDTDEEEAVEVVEIEVEVDEEGNEIAQTPFTEEEAHEELKEVITDDIPTVQTSAHLT